MCCRCVSHMTMNVFCLSAIADSSALNVQHYKGKADCTPNETEVMQGVVVTSFTILTILFIYTFSEYQSSKYSFIKMSTNEII